MAKLKNFNIFSSKLSSFFFNSTHQRLNVKHASIHTLGFQEKTRLSLASIAFSSSIELPKRNFNNWLAGMTDKHGSFSFSVNKKKNSIWNCSFKIAQSTYNLKLLYFIKENLQYGSINKNTGKNMAEFRIQDRKTLVNVILPVFIMHPLYSRKHFYFLRWVKALEILENNKYSFNEKNEILTKLKLETPRDTYISPAWEKTQPSDDWIYGFIEAEASFFITNKTGSTTSCSQNIHSVIDTNASIRMVHSFGITQKLDEIILQFFRKKFHISSKVFYTTNHIYKLETSNSRSIRKIQEFFLNKLNGIKSLEYKIWARSLNSKKNNEKLLKIQHQLRKIRNKNTF